jgi:Na+-driven multidrug efflux pump
MAFVRGLGMDVEGLALATALTSWANLLWLLPLLLRRLGPGQGTGPGDGPPLTGPGALARRLVPLVLASGLAGLAAAGSHGALVELAVAALGRNLGAAAVLALAAVVGVGTYFGLAALLGVPEWRVLAARLSSRRS